MNATRTLADVTHLGGVDVLDHLDTQIDVPALTGIQFQGDVAVIPTDPALAGTTHAIPVPAAGIPVVRGENGGNTHLLVADTRDVTWEAARITDATALALGTVTIPDGSTAYLIHPEHGANGLAGGTYEIRRQREQADEIRLIAD